METLYQCQQCGSEDRDHQGYTAPPIALICYKCRAGKGASPRDQAEAGIGMLPYTNEKEGVN
jgi:hypothetical protein